MKIDDLNPKHLARTPLDSTSPTDESHALASSGSAGAVNKDQAALSDRARTLGKARAALAEVPEIRADRVNALKSKVESGEYAVPVRALAARLLRREL